MVKVKCLLCSFNYSTEFWVILLTRLYFVLLWRQRVTGRTPRLKTTQKHFLPEVWAYIRFYFSVQEKMRHRLSIFITEDIQHRVHKGCFSKMVWKFAEVRELPRTPC